MTQKKKLDPGINRIKSVFKGDEQYMILTTFYKENHYHPLMALRSSFGLLIQIPFFMAAYSFLSNLESLRGYSFLFIRDMGAQDALFSIGGFPINVLPIAMTLINIVAGAIYTKGFKFKDKITIYGMALVFLAILYSSPAGLVLYWTMNNVFSLVKNIFYKIKNPAKVLYAVFAAAVLGLDFYVIFVHNGFLHKRILLAAAATLLLAVPFLVKYISRLLDTTLKSLTENKKSRFGIFIVSSIALCLFAGTVIPSFIIGSSPVEFANIDGYGSPLYFIYNSTVQTFGLFVFWLSCVYFLFNARIQAGFAVAMPVLLFIALIDAFIFSGDYGTLSRLITFAENIDSAPLWQII
ncbi:MAG: YidC/Oxa1 family membrane protein insertase [Treponema sp.]|nr:MAG: YidC/Oxa1 family membrane protein insertase [Treponema sp.]